VGAMERRGAGKGGCDDAMRRLPFVRRKEAKEGGGGDGGDGDGGWELASRHDTPIEPILEERGDWGMHVPLATSRCSRCALSLTEEALGGGGSQQVVGGEQLVTFPCGHTFHACCIADDACVRCMAARARPLRAPGALRASVAANAELEDQVVAPWVPAPRL
jgi:hypothetical protein